MERRREDSLDDFASLSNSVSSSGGFLSKSNTMQSQPMGSSSFDTVNSQLHHMSLGAASSHMNGSSAQGIGGECAGGIWIRPPMDEGTQIWSPYIPEEPHTSNWRGGQANNIFSDDVNNSFMMRPDLCWENKDQKYGACSSKSSYIWNKADKRIFPNYEDGRRYEVNQRQDDLWRDMDDRRFEERRKHQDQKRNGDDRRYEDRRRAGDVRKYEDHRKSGADRKYEERRRNGGDRKYEEHRRREDGLRRGDGLFSRNDVDNWGITERPERTERTEKPEKAEKTGRNKFGGFKAAAHSSNGKHSSNESQSSGNVAGYSKSKGWSSIPQTSNSFPSEDDEFPMNGCREFKSQNVNGSAGFFEAGATSVAREKEYLKRGKNYNPSGKTSQKAKGNEDHWKKDHFLGKSALSLKEEGYDKDKNCKTNQRERLIDLLSRGVLECLVCCEQVHQNASVWSCGNCYHVFHLRCIIKWAKSSKSDFGWRCPACQNVTREVPCSYFCFCGKVRDPEWNRSDCPHSCGEICGKTQKKACPHKCILLCHPGPCPQCTATVVKSCGCQKTTRSVQCCNSDVVTCGTICGNILNCNVHNCLQNCHMDACADCKETVHQVCYCGKEKRDIACSSETVGVEKYSCGKMCGKELSCSNHFCDTLCHDGECKKCDLLPDTVKYCPCGKSEIKSLDAPERSSCKDPIPTCDLICGKDLPCGQPGSRHTCQEKCHEGPCPVCPLETVVKCRCGHMDKAVLCSELLTRADDARCNKRCTKKRNCGKHKCNQTCCIDLDHICPLPCNRLLQCNLHRCEETCHRGHCRPCWRASFEELYCECGAEVIYPPVQCGTRKPPCKRPCTRTHNCDHPPTHNCHSASQCPPCTVLTKKYCHGRHELRKAVLCHQDAFSCGLPCNKELSCGRHKCNLLCHEGVCLKEGQICTQPCKAPRPVCGHPCGAPCHEGPCPTDSQCKEMVKVTCECGHRYTTRACHDNAKEYHRIATARLASKIADLQAGQTIDLNDVVVDSKKLSYKTLECNDECELIERNRKLALALQIRNPDLSAKLVPRYSDFMKGWAKKDARFCEMVHEKLTDLVQLAKQSKQKSRSFSFAPMNREKRQFVHEYCEHFGCKSVAYDPEPKRNVVATALKEQSWLPSMSLLEVIQRESWPRKVPAPVNMKMDALPKSQRGMEVLTGKTSKTQPIANTDNGAGTSNPSTSQIDYFDWQPSSS